MDTSSPAQTLDAFITDLLHEKFAADQLSAELETEFHAELMTKLEKWIKLKSLTALVEQSQETANAFQKLIDTSSDSAETQAFLAEHIPDQSAFLAKTLLEFRNTYLGSEKAPSNIVNAQIN